jgi:hypothetical protein
MKTALPKIRKTLTPFVVVVGGGGDGVGTLFPSNSGNFLTGLSLEFQDLQYVLGKVISRPGGLGNLRLPQSPPEGTTSS